MKRQAIEVGALSHTRLFDGEVGTTHRIIERINTHQTDGFATPRQLMLVRKNEPAALVDVEREIDLALLLQRQNVVIGVEHAHARRTFGSPSAHTPRALGADRECRLVDVGIHHDNERLQVLNNLVNIFDHPLGRLMLVHDTVETKRPDSAATQ